jgi:hypothetical protein
VPERRATAGAGIAAPAVLAAVPAVLAMVPVGTAAATAASVAMTLRYPPGMT